MTVEQHPVDHAATTARFRRAVEAKDTDALLETLAPDVVMRSPITDRVELRGHDRLRQVLPPIFATLGDIRYFADVGEGTTRALFYRADVNGHPVEEATRIELTDDGRVREITLFFRPLPGLAALTAHLVPRVARRRGRVRSLLARVLLAPLALATRSGDRLAPWLT